MSDDTHDDPTGSSGSGSGPGDDTPEIHPGGFDPLTGSLKQSFDEVFGDVDDAAEPGDGDARPVSALRAAAALDEEPAGRSLHPATEQMMSQMPPLISRGVIYAVMLFIIVALIWATLVTTDVVVRGQAVIVAEVDETAADSQVAEVHARTTVGAVIATLHARAGDTVKQGDLLATLAVQDLAQLQAAVAEAGLELSLKQATLARQDQQRRPELDAQLAKLDERRDALRQIVAHNRTTVNSLKDETATQLQSLDEEIAARGVREKLLQAGAEADIRQYEQQRLQLVAQREASSESAKRLEKQAVAAQREYEQFRDAESGGMIESARVTAAHLAWLRADSDAAAARDQTKLLTLKEGEIAVQIEQVRARNALAIDELTREVLGLTNQRKAAMAALKVKLEEYDRLDAQSAADIAEVDLQASQLRSAFDQQREELLRDIDRATLKLGQAKERAALDAEVREVRAPIDGELTFVGPKSVGEFVPPGHHLATVAGPGAKMVALITLQNRDIANIKPGQSIKFKFDAWNFQTYGVVKGEVLSVSPDAVSTDKNGEGGYVYVVRATFDRHPPSRGGEKMTIRYGMTATAEIVQRTRRVIDILIEPFQKLSENFVP